MATAPERKEASAWGKFRLLMWKNFLQQWRHRVQTLFEMILPAVTMTLVLIIRWQIEPEVVDTIHFPPIPAHTLNFSSLILAGMNVTQMTWAYSPESPLLEDVVRTSVVSMFYKNRRELFEIILEQQPDLELPDILDLPPNIMLNTTLVLEILASFVRVQAYNSSQDMQGIYSDEEQTRIVLTAIEFDDALRGATELPLNLTYALRFPERPRMNSFFRRGGINWRTDLSFPIYDTPGPRFRYSWEGGNDPGYVNEMFIAMQHAISTELIARTAPEELRNDIRDFEVNIQRYPHPAFIQDMAVDVMQLLFPMFILLSFSYTAINIVRAVTVEKELQLKETMKIMGLPTWLHWTAWFCKQFLYLTITSILVVLLLKINWFTNEHGFSDYAVFTNTPFTVLLFFILLYIAATIFFSFMVSGLFSKGSSAALFAGVIWFLTYVPAILLSMDVEMSTSVQVLTCLFINSAMSYGFQLILASEGMNGMHWGNFMETTSADTTRFPFGVVVIMLAVDCVLYMLVALYLEQVFPGPFGTPKPWYFLLQKNFWCSSGKVDACDDTIESPDVIREKEPEGHQIGVKITNLTKAYGNFVAVNNLSLNIYEDQITVLLGHNGAGKSTTISMITGNLELTRGSVWLAGYDISQQTSSARSHIGLCPQHDVLFHELTVREHLEFFARLKGLKGRELNDDVDSIIDKLELNEKRDYPAGGLSGGQKRRLCVGIALSGATKVVLLDEPTSGMDPASRRALWDLLQREKQGRTVILTTHFMDEADILGDRVAIMANGQLQCLASPYFLKRHYGVGYTLVVVKDKGFEVQTCTALVNKYIPNTNLKEDRGTEVTYNLLNEHSHIFEEMLTDLENNVNTIKFRNYGLLATTLEDVFMSVGSDVGHSISTDSEGYAPTEASDDTLREQFETSSIEHLNKSTDNVTGFALLWQHVYAIWMKLWLVWTRSWMLLLLQVLVPIIMINATLGVFQYVISFIPSIRSRPLTIAEGYLATETLLGYNGTDSGQSFLGSLASAAYGSLFNYTSRPDMTLTNVEGPIDTYYLERTNSSENMASLRHRMLIGANFDDNSAIAWFSNFGYHDVANSLAFVHKALIKAVNSSAIIRVFNHPLEANYTDQSNMALMVQMLSMQLASGVGNSVGIVSAVFVMFYIKERVSRAKLLQKAAGVQPAVMWLSAAVFDWLWFMFIAITIVLSCVVFRVVGLSTAAELGRMYLCFLVFGAAMLPLMYICSNFFNGPAMGFVIMFFVNTLFGMMGAQVVEALMSPQLDTEDVAVILDRILQLFPLYSLVTAIRSLNQIGLTEYTCLQGCESVAVLLPGSEECTMETMCQYFSTNCCVPENPHFLWDQPGILRYLVAMVGSCFVLWIVLFLVEYRVIQKLFLRTRQPPPLDLNGMDEDVVDEIKHVEHLAGSAMNDQSLVAKGLSKYYGKNLAVDQVSFSVSDGECFGLLGVNGAGKTTTFKMLMGDEDVSYGSAFVSGHSVKSDITKVHENIGYCPQFDAIFGELTGRETMRLFSLLRGLRWEQAGRQTVYLAHRLGFEKHLDKRVEQYSGGNKRKLSTAVALLGHTRLIFVDEPTTGVDPAAKRQVWKAIRGARKSGRGLVMTSHSMEECEALCTRLTIMVNGQFQCLGTPQHLKNKFSEGFTLTIKMKYDENAANDNTIEAVKEYVKSNFVAPKIMEEYQGLVTYYLPDRSVPWSRMFGVMERAKRDLSVEDYSISQTSLEQIFLQFTKYQRQAAIHT